MILEFCVGYHVVGLLFNALWYVDRFSSADGNVRSIVSKLLSCATTARSTANTKLIVPGNIG